MNLLQKSVGKLAATMSGRHLGRHLGRHRVARLLHDIVHDIVLRTLAPKYAITATIHGMRMELPNPESSMSRLIALTGIWEPAETRVVERIVKKGMIVIDCGANVGYYTLLMSKLVSYGGQVYAFEPSPAVFRVLRRNIAYNDRTNVTPFNVAVTDGSSKQAVLHISNDTPGYDTLADFVTDTSAVVECRSLDYYFSARHIDFIKMDIQGAEYLALEGMRCIMANNPKLKMLLEFAPEWIRKAGGDPDAFWGKLEADFVVTKVGGSDDVINVLCTRRNND